jgi:uncharacterized membrane protein
MKNNQTKRLVLVAFFVAIEIVLAMTPLGYVPIGPIRATTIHIPVIIASLVLGYKEGAIVGLVFGLTSLFNNTFNPTALSFVFSPFIEIGGYSGNFASLIIVLVPRVFLGITPYFFLKVFKKLNINLNLFITSILSTLIHTFLVLGMIVIFFGPQFANLRGTDMSGVITFIIGIITTNGIVEAIVAGITCTAVYKALGHVYTSED